VWAGTVASIANRTDLRPLAHTLAGADKDTVEMGVESAEAMAMINHDMITVA
jgi:hypothetical protein